MEEVLNFLKEDRKGALATVRLSGEVIFTNNIDMKEKVFQFSPGLKNI
jgi:uncharacterized pyridoxamine 5'-phosphate oxidase family protein